MFIETVSRTTTDYSEYDYWVNFSFLGKNQIFAKTIASTNYNLFNRHGLNSWALKNNIQHIITEYGWQIRQL